MKDLTKTSLNKFLLVFYIVASAFGILGAMLQKYLGSGYPTMSYENLLFAFLFNYSNKFLFIWLAIICTRRYLLPRNLSIVQSFIIHFVWLIIFSTYSSFCLLLFDKYILEYADPITGLALLERMTYGSSFNFFVYFSLIAIVYAFDFLQRKNNIEIRQEKLRSQLLDSKISVLQSQLQPHFLFNALNDISALVDISPGKSQDAISDLSEMLRLTLGLKNEKLIPLSQELDILNKYIDLEKTRFSEKLEILIENKIEQLGVFVPPLIIQPIIENSIKHGFDLNIEKLLIRVVLQIENDRISYTISNNGSLLEGDDVVYGTGISNIVERLDSLFPDSFVFDMKNANDLVVTKIVFPLGKQPGSVSVV